jgi:hypothetical protein
MAPEQDHVARSYLGLLQRGSLDSAVYQLTDTLAGDHSIRSSLQVVSDSLRGARLDSLRIVGASVYVMGGHTTAELTYETPRQPTWRLISVRVEDTRIAGLHVNTDPAGIYHFHALRWTERPAWRWPFLVLPFIVLGGSLAAAVYVWRIAPRRRWLLALLALLGLGKVILNWSTGDLALRLLTVSFGGGISRSTALEPWIASFTLPIGAMIAVVVARRLRRRAAAV